MKLLSVIVPSYNVGMYLPRCLDSLLYDETILENLDIIVVNDGSKDDTLAVAKKYKQQFPSSITVVDKENGGHGSTINAGIAKARGKYFKVIDADDWVNIDEFSTFVRALQKLEDDILITNYQQDILYDSSVVEYDFYKDDRSQDIATIQSLVDEDDFFFMFSMHSMTIKTASLKRVWGTGLLEKTFYVDQQYVAKALTCAKTFRTLNYDIYRYFIGRPEQSVSAGGFFGHRQDHERVLRWLLSELQSEEVQSHEYLAAVLQKQVEAMIATHYEIYYTMFTASKDDVEELFEFDNYLGTNFPELHQSIPASQNVRRRLSSVRRMIKRKLLVRE